MIIKCSLINSDQGQANILHYNKLINSCEASYNQILIQQVKSYNDLKSIFQIIKKLPQSSQIYHNNITIFNVALQKCDEYFSTNNINEQLIGLPNFVTYDNWQHFLNEKNKCIAAAFELCNEILTALLIVLNNKPNYNLGRKKMLIAMIKINNQILYILYKYQYCLCKHDIKKDDSMEKIIDGSELVNPRLVNPRFFILKIAYYCHNRPESDIILNYAHYWIHILKLWRENEDLILRHLLNILNNIAQDGFANNSHEQLENILESLKYIMKAYHELQKSMIISKIINS